MKKVLVVIWLHIFAFTPLILLAQETQDAKEKEPATKLERFLAKKGTLIIKDIYNCGNISGMYGSRVLLKVIVIYEPGKETERVRGLKIEVSENSKFEKNNASFLDFEEVESLSKALLYMLDLAQKWENIEKEYTEVVFSTKGYLDVGFFQKSKVQTPFVSSGYVNKSMSFDNTLGYLISLKNFIDKALEVLKEK